MTLEEAKAMEGTEFTYIFKDGDSIPAYVKKFDHESGRLTCYSLENKTKNGWIPIPDKDTMPDGTFCLIGATRLNDSLPRLEKIKSGKLIEGECDIEEPNKFAHFNGCAFN